MCWLIQTVPASIRIATSELKVSRGERAGRVRGFQCRRPAIDGLYARARTPFSPSPKCPIQRHDVVYQLDVWPVQSIAATNAATKAGGRIARIDFLAGQTSALNLMPLIFRQTTLRGIAVAPRSSFDRMNKFLNEHKIRPVIDHVYPFEEARQAYEHLARGAFGKVVIKVS